MNILKFLFGKKRINSEAIASEIEKARAEHAVAIAASEDALAGLSTMTDEEHQRAIAVSEEKVRVATRASARIGELEQAHAAALVAEAEAEKVAEAKRFRQEVEDIRRAVEVDAVDVLQSYRRNGLAMADDLERLKMLYQKVQTINEALRHNPIADPIPSIDALHRKHPDQLAIERAEHRQCWVYRYPGSPPDTEHVQYQRVKPWEEIREASLKADGSVVPAHAVIHNYYGSKLTIVPTLETRNVVVERTYERLGRYEADLLDIILPPAFAGEAYCWPR